ncbi:MAG: hypothetical protein ACK5M4_09140 [Pseudorhodobacter sp.]
MDPDFLLVIGILLAVFAIPAMLSAYAEGMKPRGGAVTALLAAGLILLAFQQKPGGYDLPDIPNAFYRVIAQILG